MSLIVLNTIVLMMKFFEMSPEYEQAWVLLLIADEYRMAEMKR